MMNHSILLLAIALFSAESTGTEADSSSGLPAKVADETYAYSWLIPEPEPRAPAYRVRLDDQMMRALSHPDGRDLTIVDAGNRPVPFVQLDPGLLIEWQQHEKALDFHVESVDEPPGSTSDRDLRLTIDQQDGTRITLQPGDQQSSGRSPEHGPIYQVLVRPPSVNTTGLSESDRRLVFQFESDQRAGPDLDCRIRDAAQNLPATARLVILPMEDSRPHRYQARMPIQTLPRRGWRLTCFGKQLPTGFRLRIAQLVGTTAITHFDQVRLQPQSEAVDSVAGAFRFELEGPYQIASVAFSAARSNLVTRIALQGRREEPEPWQSFGDRMLSTISLDDPSPTVFNINAARLRQWQFQSLPSLDDPPEVSVDAIADELLFLAQGTPPWRVLIGTGRTAPAATSDEFRRDLLDHLPPAWTLPRAVPGERATEAGEQAYRPEAAPIPWRRVLLWSVLVLGSIIVVRMSFAVLRETSSKK